MSAEVLGPQATTLNKAAFHRNAPRPIAARFQREAQFTTGHFGMNRAHNPPWAGCASFDPAIRGISKCSHGGNFDHGAHTEKTPEAHRANNFWTSANVGKPGLAPWTSKSGAREGTRTLKPFGTRSLVLRVYQFRHPSRVCGKQGREYRHFDFYATADLSFCKLPPEITIRCRARTGCTPVILFTPNATCGRMDVSLP